MPTVTLDVLHFGLLLWLVATVGGAIGALATARRMRSEFEARLAAAEDAAESDGFERGAASVAEHLGGPGHARKRGGQ